MYPNNKRIYNPFVHKSEYRRPWLATQMQILLANGPSRPFSGGLFGILLSSRRQIIIISEEKKKTKAAKQGLPQTAMQQIIY